jgi:hypothetical protein
MSVYKIDILNKNNTNPPQFNINLIYSNGKTEKINNILARDLIRLYKGNGLSLPDNLKDFDKKSTRTDDNEVQIYRNRSISKDILVTIANVKRQSGRNNYCNATVTTREGDEKNITVSIEELEALYNDNFMFIPESVQSMFDQYYAKNGNYYDSDNKREKNFVL